MRLLQERLINQRAGSRIGAMRGIFQVVEKRDGIWIAIYLKGNARPIVLPDFAAEVDGGVIGRESADQTPRNIYLSPDERHIVIDKHINSTTNVCNLYRRQCDSATMIRPDGMRFDEACVQRYCQQKGTVLRSVTGGGRDCFLMGWRGSNIGLFDVASSHWGVRRGKDRRSIFFRAEFDLDRQRFLNLYDIPRWR